MKPIISGIYALKYRDWYYIGCSTNIHQRFYNHKSKLRNGTHFSKEFQKHYSEFGGEIELIILMESNSHRLTYDENDFIIDYRKAGLNVYNIYPSQLPFYKSSTKEFFNTTVKFTIHDCTVCNGMKIISMITGRPPIK